MSEKDDKYKKSTRREFLKLGLRAAGRGTAYAIGGNIAGRVYRGGRDATRYVAEPVTNTYDAVKKKTNEFFNKLQGKNEGEEKPEKKEPEEVSRRGFFGSLFNYFHEHPVLTGTSFGATYGTGKSLVKNLENYKTKIEKAKSEDAINTLTNEVRDLKKIIMGQKIKGLEDRMGGGTLLVVGFSILIVSIILNSWDLTGYTILGYKKGIFSVDVFLFVISLIFIFIGFKRNNR